tara:strand:- start:27786 stop:27986 length:201 start_codon:yes stop_codon:yes gene_type:complete
MTKNNDEFTVKFDDKIDYDDEVIQDDVELMSSKENNQTISEYYDMQITFVNVQAKNRRIKISVEDL